MTECEKEMKDVSKHNWRVICGTPMAEGQKKMRRTKREKHEIKRYKEN